jgi:lipopolysaccharide/colanic/teichoic acid biosynthesis glycosyltransferase
MIENAESESGPIWSRENDPRITRVGRLLRKGRLDELPQLWNILKGDMSFVGPRPIREHFANQLAGQIPFYGLRFSVKPGLTGWAQVNYDYAGSEEGQMEKFQYELFYIQNMSLFLDLLALFKTVHKVFAGEGK